MRRLNRRERTRRKLIVKRALRSVKRDIRRKASLFPRFVASWKTRRKLSVESLKRNWKRKLFDTRLNRVIKMLACCREVKDADTGANG